MNKHIAMNLRQLGFSLLLPGLLPLSINAQILEEIVVTAQKREQSVQDVSIAITAWSGDMLDDLGLISSSEIARMTSGVHLAPTSGGQDAQFTIRGVTQTDFNDTIEPPNAVYVDEGYMATVQGQRFGMFDLERVEVLKGPQGTLFGRNATGGLVHYITRKPTDEFEAFADVTYGSYEQVRVESAISGALSENISARISGLYSRHDEYIENVFPAGNVTNPVTGQPFTPSPSGADDTGNDNQWAVRGQFLWKVNEDAELLLSAFASREKISTGAYEQGATTAVIDANGNHVNSILAANDLQGCEAISAETGACLPIDFVDGDFDLLRPVQGGDLFGFRDPGGGGDETTSVDHAIDDFNEYDVEGVTARLNWDFDSVVLTAVTHYVNYDKVQSLDVDIGPAPQNIVMNNNQTMTISQELRLDGESDRYHWVAGYYFLHIDNDNAIGLAFSPDSPITLLAAGGTPFETDSFVAWDRYSHSLFGQIDYTLNEQWTFIAGLRLISEENDFQYDQINFINTNDATIDNNQPPLVLGIEYPSFSANPTDFLWAARAVLEYRPNDDWMFYGGVNRGTKAGGFNGKLNDFSPPLPAADVPYDEEVLLAYEAGFKSTVLDGKVQLNGSVYYYDYTDYQGFVFTGSSGFVRNADAEYFGLELEVAARPVNNLDVILNASWIDAEIKGLEVATAIFRDVEPAHTPEWQVAGLARYTWPGIAFGGDVSLQMDFNYADSRFHNIRNFDAQKFDAYVLANARLAWDSADQRWEASFFANNITDEDYRTTGFDLATFCGCSEEAYGKPRWFGARVRYTWN